MSQEEIIDFLRDKKESQKWVHPQEIVESLNLSKASVSISLKKLRRSQDVEFKIGKTRVIYYLYKYREN